MAQDIKVSNKDEVLATARKISSTVDEAVDLCKRFIADAEACGEGISGLEAFKTAVQSIHTELAKLQDTCGTAESSVKRWYDKLEEADNILKNASLEG